jgi:hypothetical protein
LLEFVLEMCKERLQIDQFLQNVRGISHFSNSGKKSRTR